MHWLLPIDSSIEKYNNGKNTIENGNSRLANDRYNIVDRRKKNLSMFQNPQDEQALNYSSYEHYKQQRMSPWVSRMKDNLSFADDSSSKMNR